MNWLRKLIVERGEIVADRDRWKRIAESRLPAISKLNSAIDSKASLILTLRETLDALRELERLDP